MCAYCMIGDFQFRHSPPWIERLREYLDLLKQVKALEDQLKCPCEPNKANYIAMFEQRIAALKVAQEQA